MLRIESPLSPEIETLVTEVVDVGFTVYDVEIKTKIDFVGFVSSCSSCPREAPP